MRFIDAIFIIVWSVLIWVIILGVKGESIVTPFDTKKQSNSGQITVTCLDDFGRTQTYIGTKRSIYARESSILIILDDKEIIIQSYRCTIETLK